MIHIDASRYNNTNKRTGVENYSYFLINELVKDFGDEIHLISAKKIELEVKQSVIPFARLWTHVRLSWFVLLNKIQTLFVPSHVLPLICPKQSIITIHDVAFKRFPESYSAFSRWYLDWSTRFAVKRAVAIITPSESTRQDLIDFYGADERRLHVVPLGIEKTSQNKIKTSEEEEKRILEKYLAWVHMPLCVGANGESSENSSLPLKKKSFKDLKDVPPYFLYIGRLEHKKNIDTLLKAFKLFNQKYPDVFLVLAGFKGLGVDRIMAEIKNLPFERLIFTGYISEKAKSIFMKHARCFIFPSRYEGFGLPLLEAMKYKLPIIASNIPSSKEILGDEAYFFDTENHQKLTKQMEKIFEGSKKHEKWTENYPQKLRRYSWKKCAQRTMKVLKNFQ